MYDAFSASDAAWMLVIFSVAVFALGAYSFWDKVFTWFAAEWLSGW